MVPGELRLRVAERRAPREAVEEVEPRARPSLHAAFFSVVKPEHPEARTVKIQGMSAAGHPVADPAAGRVLGEALRRKGYSEDAVVELLGDEAYSGDREDIPVFERRLSSTHLDDILRLFFLQRPVSKQRATDALGAKALEALQATALAEVADEVAPRGRILPLGKLLVASDDYPPGDEPPDYVAAYTPTSRICEALTPRHRVARALDVGTGSGVQALFAARHARQVVATDVNARALAYTELNAGLNGLDNVECRQGSFFEPVAGETFDLITCNAPYVVSPEKRWVYRDAGFEADELSERLVENAAAHLAEDGFATMILSWVADDEEAPDEHALAWTKRSGCDGWILPVWGSDPLEHAATWNVDLAGDGTAFPAALDEWTQYLSRLRVRWVTEGAIVLHHRRSGKANTVRVDELDEDDLEDAGDQVRRAFAARARLAELGKQADLLNERLSVASPLDLEREVRPSRRGRAGDAYIHLAAGTASTLAVAPAVLEVVAALDGTRELGDVIRAAGKRGEQDTLRRQALAACKHLLELGALEFA
jgi:methylase of polypeptide subunit release factors